MKKILAVVLVLALTLSLAAAKADFTAKAAKGTVAVKTTKDCKIVIQKGVETHHYDMKKGEEANLPLAFGKGKYSITEYDPAEGNLYREAKKTSLYYRGDPDEVFRKPNIMVNYDQNNLAIQKAEELCAGLDGEKAKASAVYKWVCAHFAYDYVGAAKIASTKKVREMVDIDQTFEVQIGVCYDLSVMTCAMLRSVGVTAKLAIGHGHCWVIVVIDGHEKVMDVASKLQTGNATSKGFRYVPEELF